MGTWIAELRTARNTGRLIDPESLGYRHQLTFKRPASVSPDHRWWNGLLYSRWQLLDLHDCAPCSPGAPGLAHDGDRPAWRSRALTEWGSGPRTAARAAHEPPWSRSRPATSRR